MTEKPVNGDGRLLHERVQAEMLDSFDEELELEIDDDRLDNATRKTCHRAPRGGRRPPALLQGTLSAAGRTRETPGLGSEEKDQAGGDLRRKGRGRQGGVIKRIAQRLNPRVCRVAALPAPNERERTQWYFSAT